jgi:hypothetical protein
MVPANARRTIIIRYGIKYLRDLTMDTKMVLELFTGLNIT